MEKVEIARRLIEELRDMHTKIDSFSNVSGFYIYEFLTELESIQDIVIDLLDVPPWDVDREIVYDYIWGRADYDFDEMLVLIEKARDEFNVKAWEDFCDTHEHEKLNRRSVV